MDHDCPQREDIQRLVVAVEKLEAKLDMKESSNGYKHAVVVDDIDDLWDTVNHLREEVARLSLWMRINGGLFVAMILLALKVIGVG